MSENYPFDGPRPDECTGSEEGAHDFVCQNCGMADARMALFGTPGCAGGVCAEKPEAELALVREELKAQERRRSIMESEADRNLGRARAAEQRASEARALALEQAARFVEGYEPSATANVERFNKGREILAAGLRALAALPVEPAR